MALSIARYLRVFQALHHSKNRSNPSSKLGAHFMLDIVRELTLDITSIRAWK